MPPPFSPPPFRRAPLWFLVSSFVLVDQLACSFTQHNVVTQHRVDITTIRKTLGGDAPKTRKSLIMMADELNPYLSGSLISLPKEENDLRSGVSSAISNEQTEPISDDLIEQMLTGFEMQDLEGKLNTEPYLPLRRKQAAFSLFDKDKFKAASDDIRVRPFNNEITHSMTELGFQAYVKAAERLHRFALPIFGISYTGRSTDYELDTYERWYHMSHVGKSTSTVKLDGHLWKSLLKDTVKEDLNSIDSVERGTEILRQYGFGFIHYMEMGSDIVFETEVISTGYHTRSDLNHGINATISSMKDLINFSDSDSGTFSFRFKASALEGRGNYYSSSTMRYKQIGDPEKYQQVVKYDVLPLIHLVDDQDSRNFLEEADEKMRKEGDEYMATLDGIERENTLKLYSITAAKKLSWHFFDPYGTVDVNVYLITDDGDWIKLGEQAQFDYDTSWRAFQSIVRKPNSNWGGSSTDPVPDAYFTHRDAITSVHDIPDNVL